MVVLVYPGSHVDSCSTSHPISKSQVEMELETGPMGPGLQAPRLPEPGESKREPRSTRYFRYSVTRMEPREPENPMLIKAGMGMGMGMGMGRV